MKTQEKYPTSLRGAQSAERLAAVFKLPAGLMFAAAVLFPAATASVDNPPAAAAFANNPPAEAVFNGSNSLDLQVSFPAHAPQEVSEWAKNIVKIVIYRHDDGQIHWQGSGFLVKHPAKSEKTLLTASYYILSALKDSSLKTAFFDSSGHQLTIQRTWAYSKKQGVLILEPENPSQSGFSLARKPLDNTDGPVYVLGYFRGRQFSPEDYHFSKSHKTLQQTLRLMEGVSFHHPENPQFGIVNRNDYQDLYGGAGGPVLNSKGEVAGALQQTLLARSLLHEPSAFFHEAFRAGFLMDALSGRLSDGYLKSMDGVLAGLDYVFTDPSGIVAAASVRKNYFAGDNLSRLQRLAEDGAPAARLLTAALKREAWKDIGFATFWGAGFAVSTASALYLGPGLSFDFLDRGVFSYNPQLIAFGAAGVSIGMAAAACRAAFQTFQGLKKPGAARKAALPRAVSSKLK